MSFNFANYVRLSIPEGSVKKITRKSDGLVLWIKKYVNQVLSSTEADGKTIYNGGLGYKDGYRIRSGGAEGASSDSICTGYIPFKKGDVLRISPAFTGLNTSNALNFSDASFVNQGQFTAQGNCYGICTTNRTDWLAALTVHADGVSVLDISQVPNAADVAYVRITNDTDFATASNFVVTVNEEITQ